MLSLEKKTIEFDGKSYELCCNMLALEQLEELHGGSMKGVFEMDVNHVNAELLLIMLNEARADNGEEAVTKRAVGKAFNYAMLRELDIFGMFLRAMSPEANTAQGGEQNTEKN